VRSPPSDTVSQSRPRATNPRGAWTSGAWRTDVAVC
jgi:hypothetical protein